MVILSSICATLGEPVTVKATLPPVSSFAFGIDRGTDDPVNVVVVEPAWLGAVVTAARPAVAIAVAAARDRRERRGRRRPPRRDMLVTVTPGRGDWVNSGWRPPVHHASPYPRRGEVSIALV